MGRRLGGCRIGQTTLRRLAWPAVTTLVLLALTLSLGVWQIHRLAWKQSLLAEIDRGEADPPSPLVQEKRPFRRVFASGTFLPGVARYGAEVRQGSAGTTMGSHLLSVLQTGRGDAVVVDRGWAPEGTDTPPSSGEVQVSGYVRPPDSPSRWGPGNDEAARRFFALDPAAVGRSLGVPNVAPFTLVALGDGRESPQMATAMPRPSNDHLSYAVTWFLLSGVLVGGFAIYACQVVREVP